MKKVLVVDDEKEIRTMVAILLRKWGHQVLEAEDGMEGFKASEEHNPDLVITDLIMPKMRGEELIRQLKKTRRIKIIVISGIDKLEPVARAAGCDDFIQKPFDIFLLKEKVARLLAK